MDLDAGIVRLGSELRREKIEDRWQYLRLDPKAAEHRPDKAERTVAMRKFVVAAVDRQRQRPACMREKAKVRDVSFGSLVFTTRTGRPIGNSDLDHRFA